MIYQSDLLKTHYKSQGKSNPKDSSSINYPAASGRGMRRKDTNFTPLPYPSPQGEGTSGNPTASGWGIKNIIKIHM